MAEERAAPRAFGLRQPRVSAVLHLPKSVALLQVAFVTLVTSPGCTASPAPACGRGKFKFSLENTLKTNTTALMGLHAIFCFLSGSDLEVGSGLRAGWVGQLYRHFCALSEACWVRRVPSTPPVLLLSNTSVSPSLQAGVLPTTALTSALGVTCKESQRALGLAISRQNRSEFQLLGPS